jgi:adenylate cyclase
MATATARAERRLAAIMVADIVGYSRLIEQDEASTLAAIKSLREQAIDPLLTEHKGRIVKLMGDGAIAEFASVVDAVACAVMIQKVVGELQAKVAADRRIVFRIGINLGDVVVDGDDLLGDGVNVAARLEGLAEPGGIVVSGTVFDHLFGQSALAFASLGEQQLKNIARPIRAYRLTAGGVTAPPAPVKAGERPSIAVLPFDNLSSDPDQTYFSDGITEDLITALSRFRDLRVLARHSSFAFRGQPLDAAELGRRLDVGYLLEGSVRRAGERVRVTAQLIDAVTGAHLWADRYDRPLDDIFAVQDEVVAQIATTLPGRIETAGLERAKRKPTSELAAYDCVLRGMEHLAHYGAETNASARAQFEQAVTLDPDYALAHAYLALTILSEDWGEAVTETRALCLAHAQRAVTLDDSDGRCHRVLATVLLNAREFDRADFHSERGLALNPNDAHSAAHRGYLLTFLGRPEEALASVREAINRNPFPPAWYWGVLGRALYGTGHYEEAIVAFDRAAARRYEHDVRLAACHARLCHAEQARACIERALAAKPDFSSRAWAGKSQFRYEVDRERLIADLLAAGLPP